MAGRSKSPSRRSARSTAPPVAFVAGPASRTAGTKHESGGSGGGAALAAIDLALGSPHGRCLYAVQFVDAFAVSITVTHLTSYTRTFSSGMTVATAISLVSSLYGFSQLFAAPVIGRLGDRHGRRLALSVSLACTAVGYALMAAAGSLTALFASRVLVGLSKHTSDLSRAHVAAVTRRGFDEAAARALRAATIGRMNTFAALGFILGPMVSGALVGASEKPGQERFRRLAALTSALFLLNAGVVWRGLGGADDGEGARQGGARQGGKRGGAWKVYQHVARQPRALLLLLLRFGLTLAVMVQRSGFALVLEDRFGTTPRQTGLVMSYQGLLGASCSSLVGPALAQARRMIVARRGELGAGVDWVVLLLGAAVQAGAYVCAAAAVAWPQRFGLGAFLAAMFPQFASSALLRVTTIAMLAECVPPDEAGTLMGGIASFTSVSRSVAPIIVGVLLSRETQPSGDGGGGSSATSYAYALPSVFAACIVGGAALAVALSGIVASASDDGKKAAPSEPKKLKLTKKLSKSKQQ